MSQKNISQILVLESSQAARFADEFVQEPISSLELRTNTASKSKQTMSNYSRGRDSSQNKGGTRLINRLKTETKDANEGRGEASNQLIVRRLKLGN